MPIPPRTPAEWLASIMLSLSLTLDGHSTWGRLARPLALLIINRIREINQRFRRLADRVAAGTYTPRRSTKRRKQTSRSPRRPNKLPQDFAWLIKLVQETAAYGSQLQALFRDPEMAALMQAAPGPMRRPLRSLCHMLGVRPPPILARPARAAPAPSRPPPAPKQAQAAGRRAKPQQPPKPPPAGTAPPPRTAPPSPPAPHACGPPLPVPA